jgi:hypothetical protein
MVERLDYSSEDEYQQAIESESMYEEQMQIEREQESQYYHDVQNCILGIDDLVKQFGIDIFKEASKEVIEQVKDVNLYEISDMPF